MNQVLYYSYGSNLDGDQMRSRCPSAVPDTRAVLLNYSLAFGGYSQRWNGAVANVVANKGARVEGLLYRIDVSDLVVLDRFEGYPYVYDRVVKIVVDEHGRRRRAMLYLQPENDFDAWIPQQKYFNVIWHGYMRLGFDLGPLTKAAGVKNGRPN